jgi:hypothetical protein
VQLRGNESGGIGKVASIERGKCLVYWSSLGFLGKHDPGFVRGETQGAASMTAHKRNEAISYAPVRGLVSDCGRLAARHGASYR